jgi:hypothetical protein
MRGLGAVEHVLILSAAISPKLRRGHELRPLQGNPLEDGTAFAFPFGANLECDIN